MSVVVSDEMLDRYYADETGVMLAPGIRWNIVRSPFFCAQ